MKIRILAIALVLLCSPFNAVLAQNNIPDESIYHLDSTWYDHTGNSLTLKQLQGKVRVVAFVYTYCEHTCPIIVARIKAIMAKLNEQAKQNTMVTLVTLDPERDTVERVQQYMQEKKLNTTSWQILVGDADDVLTLSALFGVRYKPMGQSDIAHSNIVSVIDQQGRLQGQLKGLRQDTDKFVTLIETLANK